MTSRRLNTAMVIADGGARIFKSEAAAGHGPRSRGRVEASLEATIEAMADEPVGMLVLDGHGNEYKRYKPGKLPTFASGKAHRIAFDPPAFQPQVEVVVLALCWGGTQPYVDAVQAQNPGVKVIGPIAMINSATYLETLQPLIDTWRAGGNLEDVVDRSPCWVLHPPAGI